MWVIKSVFLLLLKLQKIACYFGSWIQNINGQSVCKIFYFWLVWLVKINIRGSLLDCTCFTNEKVVSASKKDILLLHSISSEKGILTCFELR